MSGRPLILQIQRMEKQSLKKLIPLCDSQFSYATPFLLLGLLILPPALVQASSPPADSIHFCAFDDYEHWRRDYP